MKSRFLRIYDKINMPATSLALLRRDQWGAAAPDRLFIKGVIGCNPTMLPGIREMNGG